MLLRDTQGALAGEVMNETESLFLRVLTFAGGDVDIDPKEDFLDVLSGSIWYFVGPGRFLASSYLISLCPGDKFVLIG